MAMVGLVWALAVLGALFMGMSAQGQHHDGGYSLSVSDSHTQQTLSVSSGDAPRTAGLVLALLVLSGGAVVLVVGAMRGADRNEREHTEPEPEAELSVSTGLGLAA